MLEIVLCFALLGDAQSNDRAPERPVTRNDVENLARTFRIETYYAYRLDRRTYDQRAAAGAEVLEIARQLPVSAPEHELLAAWFRAATQVTLSQGDLLPSQPHVDLDALRVAEAPTPGPAPRMIDHQQQRAQYRTAEVSGAGSPEGPTAHGAAEADPHPEVSLPEESGSSLPLRAIGSLFRSLGRSDAERSSSDATPNPSRTNSDSSRRVPASVSPTSQEPAEVEQSWGDATLASPVDTTNVAPHRDNTTPQDGAARADAADQLADTSPVEVDRNLEQLRLETKELERRLKQPGLISPEQAFDLMMQVTILDVGNMTVGLSQSLAGEHLENDVQSKLAFSNRLLQQLRDRVATDFDGSSEEQQEILAQIDQVIEQRQNQQP